MSVEWVVILVLIGVLMGREWGRWENKFLSEQAETFRATAPEFKSLKSCTCPNVDLGGYSKNCCHHGERAQAHYKGNLPPCDMQYDVTLNLSDESYRMLSQ